MYLTKKHLSRRTVLKGVGASVGLPLLDAMIPAATALAQTAAAPKLRVGFFYIPHGAILWNTPHGPEMDHWTPSGAGADFKLSPILEPLEDYKHLVSSFSNLENKASAESVHRYNPATRCSSASRWMSHCVTSAIAESTRPCQRTARTSRIRTGCPPSATSRIAS